ncbi:hypothetical protein QZH41_012814, partial [Actinostola sp. cb2023]
WDELLDGGLYSGEVTEIVGTAGSGKTQVCLSIASFVAMNLEKNIIYIDTQGSFSSERIKEMLKARDSMLTEQDIISILSRIQCFQTFDLFGLVGCLNNAKNSFYSEDDIFYNNVQLIVVDSVASVLTPVLGGQQITGKTKFVGIFIPSHQYPRHSMMVHLSRSLKSLAVQHGLAVMVTNNVVSDSKALNTGGIKPALGPTWSHIPNTRVFIQKGTTSSNSHQTCERIATVTKSSRQVMNPLFEQPLFSLQSQYNESLSYKLYGYVPPHRVWFSSFSGLG